MACISCLLVPRVLCCGSSLHLLEGSERATPTLGKTLVALAATSLCRHLKWANRRMCSACFGTIVQLLIQYWMVEKSCKHVFDQEKSGWVWPSTLCDISLCTEMTALIPEVEFFLTARMSFVILNVSIWLCLNQTYFLFWDAQTSIHMSPILEHCLRSMDLGTFGGLY